MRESAVTAKIELTLNLLIKQTSHVLLLKATRLMQLFSPKRTVQISVCIPKQYEKPTSRKLTLEQARLLALGHPPENEKDSEFMRVLFPDQPKPS